MTSLEKHLTEALDKLVPDPHELEAMRAELEQLKSARARIATLESHIKLLREECRAARIWEDSHFDDDEPTMNPPVTIPHHIACKNKEAARAAVDAAGAMGTT